MNLIKLEGIANARELGGILLKNGRRVKNGCLLRTGKLSGMTDGDLEVLRDRYHVTMVVDLRSDLEESQHPDRQIPGALIHLHPIFPGSALGVTREEADEPDPMKKKLIFVRSLNGRAKEGMTSLYPMMVSDPYCVGQLKGFFSLLMKHGEGAFLWHCTAGKDRTGITAALLLWMLGASKEEIMEDYLATNEAMKEELSRLREEIYACSGDMSLAEQAVLLDSVSGEYLESAFGAIEKQYGGMERFIRKELGITQEMQQQLIEKYTK